MNRLKKFFGGFFKSPAIITALAMISMVIFQAYCLKKDYDEKRNDLLTETANRLNAVILADNLRQINKYLHIASVAPLPIGIAGTQTIIQKKTHIYIFKQSGNSGKRLNNASISVEPDHEGFAAKLKASLKSINIEFILHPQGTSIKILKPFQARIVANSPLISDQKVYEILITDYNSAILKKMQLTFWLSLIYLAICLGAIFSLHKNLAKASHYIKLKKSFTNNMTHELKTPISVLQAGIESLLSYNAINDKEVAKEYMELMKTEVSRLNQMVDSILTHAELEYGKTILSYSDIHLRSLILNCVLRIANKIDKSQATINFEHLQDEIHLKADPGHLANVFLNLLDNSIKYSEQPPSINISASMFDNIILIEVSDNGIGIPEKYHNEIFEPYFRVPENELRTIKGYGLGLNYVQQIIKLHGGTIVVNSSKKGGTSFQITLPGNND